jgi:N6-adenosine-specific RNA methylase IME4
MKLYNTIVVDPPWTPEQGSTWKTRFTDKARPQKFYKTLSLEEIITYEPPSEKKSHLYLWVINQHIDWGYKVAEAWGFKVIQMLTWCKPGLGTGQFQCNTEHVLVCRKGSRAGNPFGMTGGTYFNWPRGKHSQKPVEFYKLVEKCSPAPYLEMYARDKRDGWDSWGNEINSDIEIDNIKS